MVHTNDVGCVCVTETWFKPYMSTESVGLAGFCCERTDRLEKGGGGVACYVAETIPYERLHDLEEEENWSMREYMINSLDTILRGSPDCGVILSGDFNQFKDTFLRTYYGYEQLAKTATRNFAILDKMWSNMYTACRQ